MPPRLCIIGLGLIGGSFALALKRAGFDGEIVGYGRSESSLQVARARGAIDHYELSIAQALAGCDAVILAVPMGAMGDILKQCAPCLAEHTIISDAGSVKASFIAQARACLGSLRRVVPGHPIAGTEHSGIHAAFPELFQDRRVVLTPDTDTEPAAINYMRHLWEQTGATVDLMDAQLHDQLLAHTSHLPHALAFALVNLLANDAASNSLFRYVAGGFRDFTRIASSDPTMWRDICLANADSLTRALRSYRDQLDQLLGQISSADGEALHTYFMNAKSARDAHLEQPQG